MFRHEKKLNLVPVKTFLKNFAKIIAAFKTGFTVPPLLNFQNFEAALRGSRATQDDKTWYANSRGQGC